MVKEWRDFRTAISIKDNIKLEKHMEKVYITGIARNVCVYWTAMDLLNYWILPAFINQGKIIKLSFVYDLTRPVAPTYSITKEEIQTAVRGLIAKMAPEASADNLYDQVFEIIDSGLYTSENPPNANVNENANLGMLTGWASMGRKVGGRRSRNRSGSRGNSRSNRNSNRNRGNRRNKKHMHTKKCKKSCRR